MFAMQVINRIKRVGDGTHYKYGNVEARKTITAIGILHPLNPSYTTTLKPTKIELKPSGLPLFHETDILDNLDDITLGPRKRPIAT